MGKITTYYLTPEELKAHQNGVKNRNPYFQPKEPTPRELKNRGWADRKIINKISRLNASKLKQLKKKWKR